jgi:hypothetical protein
VLSWKVGIGPNIARTFLVCAAELGTYDEFKTQLLSRNLLADGPVAHLCASSAAAFVSAGTATPVDVVKTRLMNQAGVQADNACSQVFVYADASLNLKHRLRNFAYDKRVCVCMRERERENIRSALQC